MQMDFFPSRTLTLYLARLFFTRIVAVLIMLVLVLQTLDLLGESGDILAYPGNGQAQLLYYVSLRLPQLVARFLPYSVLLATIFTLATLNQNSEVVAMKSAGLSAHQVLAPLILTAALFSLFSFGFNERVVTRATATLDAWDKADYGPIPKDSGVRTNVYLTDGHNLLLARSVAGVGEAMTMTGVTWYRRDATGMIVEKVQSPRATHGAAGWTLERPVRFRVADSSTAALAPLVVGPELTPEKVSLASVDADEQNIVTLWATIGKMREAGRRTDALESVWWHKISGPLSSVLMPLLGAIAAFGLARSGQLLIRAVIGMALGFAYFVIDNAALAMGSFGGYPPMVAAWAPFILFALIGEAVLVRTEE
ncbi:LPS export ABC transporter permease LptG [Novosphingobium colocasiae]|uniref:LPS export ABC transporter permease LptG n=1 Tax=Novosphingobium colocasiae TaxID=1256513 RepID=UPI0035B05856